jgi:hypothetical protein
MVSKQVRLSIKLVLIAITASGAMACKQNSQSAAQAVYASLPGQHEVAVFAVTAGAAATPLATIKETAADIPIDVGVDMEEEVFIANQNANIQVYGGRNYNYQRIHLLQGPNTQLQHPNAMAIDPVGGIYIADAGNGSRGPRILVFSPNMNGDIPPDHWIGGPDTELETPTGISIDATGRAFVADHASGKVLIFEANTRGDTPPIATIGNLPAPNRVLVDENLNLYVDSGSNHSITVFIPSGPHNWSRNATITASELENPLGMAVDASGRLAVAIPGQIVFFAANASGPSAPVQSLQGPVPFNPTGIAIH